MKYWSKHDGYVKQVIAASLPESLFLRVQKEETAKSVWDTLTNLFQNRSRVVAIDLRRKLQETRCTEKGDLRAHFDKLRLLREQLAALGQSISDDDFAAIVISSLPNSYDSNIAAITSSALVSQSDLTPDFIMRILSDEYDRRQTRSKKTISNSEDAAYSAKDLKKSTTVCENCKKKGHSKEQCWKDGGGKAGQAPKWFLNKTKKGKETEKAATATTAASAATRPDGDAEPDGVWLAHAQDDDWLTEIAEEDTPNLADLTIDEEEAYTKTYDHALLAGEGLNSQEETTLFDSGASRHMSSYRGQFLDYKPIVPKPITAADNHTFHAIGKGDLMILLPNGKGHSRIRLRDVLYAPKMGITLISISKLDLAGYAALFRDKRCQIFDARKKKLGEVPLNKGLYCVKRLRRIFAGLAKASDLLTMAEVHTRLGHIAPTAIRAMLKDGTITGITLDEAHSTMGACDSCEYAKATRKPIGKEHDPPRREELGDEVHTDLWGPSPVQMPGHSLYYASFTDDHTRYTTLYLQKMKAETFASYKSYEAWLATQFNAKVKRLRSDRGGEYLSNEFSQHLKSKGTERCVTVHDMPEHNGMAERLNRTLVERVRAMIHASGLPKNLWGEAIMHATWLKNRSSTRRLGTKTPYEVLYQKKPDLSNIPIWGCHIKVHDNTGSKLDMRACDRRWVGFNIESDGHQIYWPDTRAVGVERSVIFKKHEVIMLNNIPIEGESANPQNGSAQPPAQSSQTQNATQRSSAEMVDQHVEMETIEHAPDPLGTTFKMPPPPPHRSTRQHFESDYTRCLRTGEGTLDYMRQLRDADRSPSVQDNATLALIEDELATGDEDVDAIYAMAAAVKTDGLNPSMVNEARS